MIKILKIIILFSFLPLTIKAAEPLSIVINEIAWMGTRANSSDEWIELYNNTDQDISLEGWAFYEKETLMEPLTGTIKANSYYLIERTDDSTIQNIVASQEPSSWGGYGLNNNGEHLKLLNQESIIIDEIDCSEGWFEGDSSSFKTMERIDPKEITSIPNNWQTNFSSKEIAFDSQNNLINGTPNAKNSINLEGQPEDVIYSSDIIISEILPSPEGADSENEWIELKNQSNQAISLFNWSIRDEKGTINTYVFPENTKIEPQRFLVLTRPISGITLNNSEDGLVLIQPNQNIISSVNYVNAPLGESYNHIDSEWIWSDQPTPSATNLSRKETTEEEKEAKDKENIQEKEEIININNPEKTKEEKIIDKNNFVNVFLIAFLISIFFSFLILKLKTRIEENLIFHKK